MQLKVQQFMATGGSYVYDFMVKFLGHPQFCFVLLKPQDSFGELDKLFLEYSESAVY